MSEYVRFIHGTAEQYDALQEKDDDAIYFISDDVNGTNTIYKGDESYSVTIITDINGQVNNKTVLSSLATKNANSTKANKTMLENYDVTTLPAVVELENNTEYRYNSLTGATTVNVSISDFGTDYLFYSSLVLHNINSSRTIEEFVTIDQGSAVSNISFLNGNKSLASNNTIELLFFSNGVGMCCIGAVSNTVNE